MGWKAHATSETGCKPVPRRYKTTIGPAWGQTQRQDMQQEPASSSASRTTPLWAVLSFTFMCSIGSAVVYSGIFFLAKSQYHFGQRENFLLGLLYGLAYIPAALSVGPLLRRLSRSGVSARSLLIFLMTAMAAMCFLPWAGELLQTPGAGRSSWPIWVAVAVYSPLSGMLWPMVESFLAGGRSDVQLRNATGKFNITWASAIVITLLLIGPLVERQALSILNGLGGVHLACVLILMAFAPSPAAHAHTEHVVPPEYKRLLTFLRMLLPVSFMFISTLSPYLPYAMDSIGARAEWQTPVAAIWCAARVLAFFALERWQGWHGRWWVPIVGALVLLASFVWLVLVPLVAPGALGLPLFLIGLAAFGIGVGVIYAAALYYAMEVGSSGVDAGGTHEALIGIGYTAGPVFGLAGLGAAGVHLVRDGSATLVMLGLVALAATGTGVLALTRAARMARRGG